MSSITDLPKWVRDNQAYRINLDHVDDSAKGVQKTPPVFANVGGSANVLSSHNAHNVELHTPMLDLDIEHVFLPSSTPGHSHLYINTQLTAKKYRALLAALAEAGIVQQGILDQFDQHRATFLRLPDVKKTKDSDFS